MSIGQVIALIRECFGISKVFTDFDPSEEFNAALHQLKITKVDGKYLAAIVSRAVSPVPGYPDGKPHTLSI